MLMQYHLGLVVGHTYCDQQCTLDSTAATQECATRHNNSDDSELDDQLLVIVQEHAHQDSDNLSVAHSNASMDSMDCGWADEIECQNCDNQESGDEDETDDDEYLALHEMYEA